MTAQFNDDVIRTKACANCYVCGSEGSDVYSGLKDRLFNVPGIWNIKRCPNAGCGTYWLDPMPAEEDLGKLYTEYVTHQDPPVVVQHGKLKSLKRRANSAYLQTKFGYKVTSESTLIDRLLGMLLHLSPAQCANLDFSVFHLPYIPQGHLLEVGCGSGSMLSAMALRGWQVTGLDFDERAVGNARSKGLTVHHGDLYSQNFREGIFDAVVMSHVIEHVPDPRALLRECLRILKPGGKLVVITPSVWGRLHKIYRKNWFALDPPRHLHLFSPRSLARLINEAGFKTTRLRTTVSNVAGLWMGTRVLASGGRFNMGISASKDEVAAGKYGAHFLGYLHLLSKMAGDEMVAVCKKA